MEKQSLVFLGSKPIGYHCLHYLIEQKDNLNIDIIGLLSNDNARFDDSLSLKKLAQDNGIAFYESLDLMPEADILYSVQYHEILQAKDIAKAKKRALNLHMAALPEYRGCNQFSFAILDEAKEFGTTIHLLDERIDHGDIVAEKRFPMPANCWVNELYELTYDASLQLFKDSISAIVAGNFDAISQKSLVESRGTSMHYRKEINDIKQIELSWEKEKIERHIRSTFMPGFEPPYTIIDQQKIYFNNTWSKGK
jgi:methionyl-tRNA formyltransferase